MRLYAIVVHDHEQETIMCIYEWTQNQLHLCFKVKIVFIIPNYRISAEESDGCIFFFFSINYQFVNLVKHDLKKEKKKITQAKVLHI